MAEDNLNDGGMGDDGENKAPAWIAQLPDDLKGNDSLTQFETLGDLAKTHLDNAGKVTELEGKLDKAIFKPEEDASDEDREHFLNSLGRPETPEGYKFDLPELPDELQTLYTEEDEKSYREFAHKNGFTAEQADKAYGMHFQLLADAHAKAEKMAADFQEQAVEKLKTDWGDDYKPNSELAVRVAKFCGDEFLNFVSNTRISDGSKLGDNPMFLKAFHAVGKTMSEDTLGIKQEGKEKKEFETNEFGHHDLEFPSMDK